MNFKKSSRLIIVIAVALASVLSVGFAMNRTADASEEPANIAGVYETSSDTIQGEEDATTDYEHSLYNTRGIMTSHNNMTIVGNVNLVVLQDGNFVSVAGNEGAVVIFYDRDGIWFIPRGEEIHIDNGEPFCFDDWLYETWGVAVVDAEMDYLLEKTFLERSLFKFSIMIHLGNPSTEKILEIFSIAAELSDTSFFALTENHAIPRMTAAEIDAMGNAAFERRDTSIFSLISQHMSVSSIMDIFTQSAAESNASFFALTEDYAIPRMTAAEIDAMGNAVFERRDTSIFSLISQHISIDQRELLLERAIKENQIAFIALLGGELE
ncbi:MAG: hypothetical protein FWF81_07795 [Defluviitaleaceae bacterium]|nr:hypothetical protein [Defluviitaleaceae bacterium]